MKSKGALVAILIIAFIAVAGGSFWLGTYYEEQSRISQMRQFAASGGQSPPPGMGSGQHQGMPNRQAGHVSSPISPFLFHSGRPSW